MPGLANPPGHRPPHSLNKQLVYLSHCCNSAAANASSQALLLASTVRKHVLTLLHNHIFNGHISNQLYQQLDTVNTVQSIFEAVLFSDETPSLPTIQSIPDKANVLLPYNITRDILTAVWSDLHLLLAPHITSEPTSPTSWPLVPKANFPTVE